MRPGTRILGREAFRVSFPHGPPDFPRGHWVRREVRVGRGETQGVGRRRHCVFIGKMHKGQLSGHRRELWISDRQAGSAPSTGCQVSPHSLLGKAEDPRKLPIQQALWHQHPGDSGEGARTELTRDAGPEAEGKRHLSAAKHGTPFCAFPPVFGGHGVSVLSGDLLLDHSHLDLSKLKPVTKR